MKTIYKNEESVIEVFFLFFQVNGDFNDGVLRMGSKNQRRKCVFV